MNGRRSFIKGFGLLGAVVGGLATARTANATSMVGGTNIEHNGFSATSDKRLMEDISHLAPPGETTNVITIMGSYGEEVQPMFNEGIGTYQFRPTYVHTNKLDMTVGKDDRLWIKVGDKWKRVAIE